MEDIKPQQPPASDVKYLLVVAGLLMGIVILLSVLWFRERRNAAALGDQAATLNAQLQTARSVISNQLKGAMGYMPGGQAEPRARALQREDLPAETVTWNGRTRTVLRISAAAGRRFGLTPGDVVVVAPPPATEPKTQPATPTTTQPSTRPGG